MTSYECKQDRQALMRTVVCNAQKLSSMCQVEPEGYVVPEAWIGIRWLEQIFMDKQICRFFQYLNRQIVLIIEKLVEQKSQFTQLEEENKVLKEQCKQAQAALEEAGIALKEALQNQSQESIAVPVHSENEDLQQDKKWIQGIISLRDSLQVKLECLQDTAPEEVLSKKMIYSLLEQTAVLLQGNGVTILEETGLLDKSRHVVQDVEYTTKRVLDNQIFKTFRQGYQYDDSSVRAQEVIVYVYKGDRAKEESEKVWD